MTVTRPVSVKASQGLRRALSVRVKLSELLASAAEGLTLVSRGSRGPSSPWAFPLQFGPKLELCDSGAAIQIPCNVLCPSVSTFMRSSNLLASIFILILYMAVCNFCARSGLTEHGLKLHLKKCDARKNILSTAADHGAAVERARIETETANTFDTAEQIFCA